jgi:hypothetical protein
MDGSAVYDVRYLLYAFDAKAWLQRSFLKDAPAATRICRPVLLSERAVRIWSAIATAIASAALVGGGIAMLANLGWLGGSSRDYHEEGVAWFAGAAVLVVVALAVAIVASPRRRGSSAHTARWERAAMVVGTLGLTCAVIFVKEALETRCGGTAPFDAGSILIQHAPAILIAYGIVAPLVAAVVRYSLRVAVAAGEIAIETLVRFLSLVRHSLPPRDFVWAWQSRVARRSLLFSLGVLTFRAPPVRSLHWNDSTVT